MPITRAGIRRSTGSWLNRSSGQGALIGLSETVDRDRPVIVSEFSPGALPGTSHCSGPDYLRYLIGKGYRIGVIEPDGSESIFGEDVDGVMAAYSRSGIDHIDVVATPGYPARAD